VLVQLQQDLKAEQQRHQESVRQVHICKKTIVELQDEIDVYQKRERDSSLRIRELESCVSKLREDSDVSLQTSRVTREELADKDGQLRVARMTLETVQKQNQQQLTQVRIYNTFTWEILLTLLLFHK